MAQDDRSSYVVVDIQAAGPECAVCMEPMEWAAVAPCGHGEVCVACAARIRFFQNDRRCCICRSHCPTVFVTKASRSSQRAFLWPPLPPPALGREGEVVKHYWYHRGMGAYFDDLCQYEEMRKVCVKSPCSADPSECGNLDVGALSSQPASVIVNLGAPPQDAAPEDEDEEPCFKFCLEVLLYFIFINLTLFTVLGLFFIAAEHRYEKVIVVVAFVVLSSAFTTCLAIFACRKFRRPPSGGG